MSSRLLLSESTLDYVTYFNLEDTLLLRITSSDRVDLDIVDLDQRHYVTRMFIDVSHALVDGHPDTPSQL